SLQRGMAAKITSTDRRMVIASEILPESDKASTESPESTATIPFASGDRTEVRLVAANNGVGGPEIIIGKATMIKLGATPYLWTRYPRAAVRVLQKNLYTTKMMLTLIAVGVALLVFAKRFRALAVLPAVPLYYLCLLSAFHVEYRYISAIH